MRNRLASLFVLACLGWTRPGLAYSETLHAFLTGRAFTARAAAERALVEPATEADLAALRALFWQTASTLPDAALRAEFLARYPDPAAFDAWAFKELFMLDPAATVHGFDRTADAVRRVPRATLRQLASRWPDADERNQHRYLRDARRAVVRDARGEPLPDDPATLEMGGLTGTTSQAHAHYGLLPGPLSDDPKVLRDDPRRFAVPPDAHTFGPDFAQLYTDLALIARGSDLRGGEFLEQAFAGAAIHHLEDLANQIHTVQVGIYEFFRAAFVQSKVRDLVTLGGLFGERRSLRALGLRLIANHHLLSEDLFAKRVAEVARGRGGPPEVRAAIGGIGAGDLAFEASARAGVERGGGAFGRAIALSLIEASSPEGPEVYRLIWRLSASALRDGAGHEYDGARDDPDRWVRVDAPGGAETLAAFYELEGRGLRRAGSALRLWRQQFEAAAAGDQEVLRTEAVQRALSFLLPYHRAKEQRRAAYAPPPQARRSIDFRWPAGVAVVLALAVLAARGLRGRRRGGAAPGGPLNLEA